MNPFLSYLWKCLSEDRFDKRRLSNMFVRRRELLNMCKADEIDPTSFWVKQRHLEANLKANVTNRPKDEETDRLLCQAIASTLCHDPIFIRRTWLNPKSFSVMGRTILQRFEHHQKWIAELTVKTSENRVARRILFTKIDLEIDALQKISQPYFGHRTPEAITHTPRHIRL
jgi:hypothetical protein